MRGSRCSKVRTWVATDESGLFDAVPAVGSWALVGVRIWAGPEHGWSGEAISFDTAGRVTAIGSESEVLECLPSASIVVAGRDQVVLPGFVDAHVHVRAAAAVANGADCSMARTRDDVLAVVEGALADAKPGRWVTCTRFEPALVVGGAPSLADLDRVSGTWPVRVRHRSLHGWLFNTAACRLLDLHPRDGWWIDDDGHLGAAMGRVTPIVEFEEAVRTWSADLLRQGVTAMADLTPETPRRASSALEDWRRRGVIQQELVDYGTPATGRLKLMLGTTGARSELASTLRAAWDNRTQVAVHCADLDTLGLIIEAVERIPRRQRGRLRVEHAASSPPEWLERLANIDATIVTHPSFVWMHGDRYLADHSLQPHSWLYRLASWLRAGCSLAIGSDAPAGPAEPIRAWQSALDRKTTSGALVGAGEALSAQQVLAAMTGWAADASGMVAGRLSPGSRGSAVLVDGDPLSATGPRPAVVGVLLNGRPAFPRAPSEHGAVGG